MASSLRAGGTNTTEGPDNSRISTKGTGFAGIGGTSGASMIVFGTIAGGAGAALTGGNFWQGAATGLIVSGLNHSLHSNGNPPKKNLDIDKLIAAYPGDETSQISSADAFSGVGGEVGKVYERQFLADGTDANACALRVSMAMNDAGYDIVKGAGTYKGANGKNYILSSKGLANYISKNYNVTSSVTTNSSLSSFAGQKGIYFMQPISPKAFGALGHITIWNGNTYLGGHGYNNSPHFYSATLYKPN